MNELEISNSVLNSCPFCQGEAICEVSKWMPYIDYQVRCIECNAIGPKPGNRFDYMEQEWKEKLINLWQDRSKSRCAESLNQYPIVCPAAYGMKYLFIGTDGDFGLKINGHNFWEDYIQIKAKNLDLIDIQEVLPINLRHTKKAEKFVEELKLTIKNENAFSSLKGNWRYDFGSVKDWDLELY